MRLVSLYWARFGIAQSAGLVPAFQSTTCWSFQTTAQGELRPHGYVLFPGHFLGQRKMHFNVFFISTTSVFAQVTDPDHWVKAKVTTLEGAKRLAVKRAIGVTFSARVAKRNAKGAFEVVAEMHNSSAITRRRAKWCVRTQPGCTPATKQSHKPD
jgi:hypothetical protein